MTDKNVDIDAFATTLRFIYNGYKNVELTGDSALAVLYIGKIFDFFFANFYDLSNEISNQAIGIHLH